MNEQKKLTIGMAGFTIIIFICFGIIIVTEKTAPIFAPRIDKKLTEYINKNYTEEKNNFELKDTIYTETKFKKIINSKDNENLYFTLTYNNKKITDTYKRDYLEGKTLITTLSKKLEKDISKLTYNKTSVSFTNNLNKYSETIKEKIIAEDNIKKLRIYNISQEIETSWDSNVIATHIEKIENKLKINDYNPKYYEITITNNLDIAQSIKIKNLTSSIIENKIMLTQIIDDIIKNKETDILKEQNITYKILN